MLDLEAYPLVSPQYRKEFGVQNALTGAGESVKQILCNDLNALRQMALQSDAILIGIPHMVRDELASGLIRQLPVRGIGREPVCNVALVSLPARTPSMAAKRITAEIRRLVIPAQD